ncbi:MAG: CBS domain-containing protein [Planctomycetaceae bacterium]|nr:CBS domain-containing protein [Planctomycetaceae bacterium]
MPGWMGIRGLEPKNPHDMERQRREDHRGAFTSEAERRSHEKVREILKGQGGDMSAYTGTVKSEHRSDCDKIADLPVTEIMSGRVAVLSFDDTLLTVQGIFDRVRFHHLPVVDENGYVIGILSDRDFLRMVSPFFGTINEQNRDKEIMSRRVGLIMTRNPICAIIKETILDAVRIMISRKISCLPIVEPGTTCLLGIITWKDVVRAFCPRAFANPRDSSRLRSGVEVNPETSEGERLRAKEAESARLMARPQEASVGTDDASAGGSREEGGSASEAGEPPRRRDDEDTRIVRPGPTPKIAAQEKLRPRNSAGRAGSDLAAKQRARMREQLADSRQRSPTSESARFIIEPDDDNA